MQVEVTELPGDSESGDALKRKTAVHHEKIKLLATLLNNTAVALFAGGSVLPLVALSFPLATAPPAGAASLITIITWGLVASGLHWWARSILNGMR